MADFNVTECVIENVNGAAFLRPQKSYSIAIAGTSTTSSIPISANTQVVRLATPSSCHFRLGAGATTSDAMIPAGEVVDFSVQPDGGTSYLSVIEASSPTDIGGGGVGDSGLESVNVETLAGNKTITSTDARVQLLNPGAAVTRTITLDASLHVVGTQITIRNTQGWNGSAINYGKLLVVNSAAATVSYSTLKYGMGVTLVYVGASTATGWQVVFQDLLAHDGAGTSYGEYIYFAPTSKLFALNTGVGIGASPSSLFHVTAAGNANALRVDNTTGNLGVGVAPGAGIHVSIGEQGNNTYPLLTWFNGSAANCGWWQTGSAGESMIWYIKQNTGGNDAVYLSSSIESRFYLGIGVGGAASGDMLVDISTATIKKALGLPSLTTTERDALIGVNRMLIYNSTTNKVQAYAAGAWVDLH